ncbi:uncharacterized protein LOC134272813 [Saccostrea cucullata]|uniref:uncharacterized protein LOC134272813 n=1 Tax=Saccostrea cuccullata TaxID=36930 RepID=UPI002ED266B7
MASILSKDVYLQLENRPRLGTTDVILTAADGSNLRILGKVDLQFSLGGISFCHEFIVAEIDDLQGIFGMDFLEQNDASIQIGKGLLKIAGQQIQLDREQISVCTRVKLSKKIVVPPDSEIVVSGYAVGLKDKSVHNLVEPFKFLQQKGLLVARTLVNPENILFSVVNITDRPVRVDKNATVASLQPVDIVESSTESVDVSSELPEHLQVLFEKSSVGLTEEQKSILFELLVSYKDIFVGPDGKFGRTKLVKHSIDTGDSKPIKIPPRRLPYAQKEIYI